MSLEEGNTPVQPQAAPVVAAPTVAGAAAPFTAAPVAGAAVAGSAPQAPVSERTIGITVPTDLYFNSGIRDFAINFVQNMTDLSEKWAYRFQTIVDELCNNAIEHGSAPGEVIHVYFSFTSEYIRVVVEDSGTGTDKTTAAALYQRLEELRVQNADPLKNFSLRGRGIVKIIEGWTDEAKFEDVPGGGIRATVLKNLASAHQEDEEMNAVEGVTFGTPAGAPMA